MFYAAKAGGSISYDRFIHALDVKLGSEDDAGLDANYHFKATNTKHPLGIGKCSVERGRGADGSLMNRGGAAAGDVDSPWRRVAAVATRMVRGDESRRRRGRGCGYSLETSRDDAAAATRICRGDTPRRRRRRGDDATTTPPRRRAAMPE